MRKIEPRSGGGMAMVRSARSARPEISAGVSSVTHSRVDTMPPGRGRTLGAAPLAEQYESRLKLLEAYERCGFYAYHVAEHHTTPLGMAPSPSVFLAAATQRTRRLRFGAL